MAAKLLQTLGPQIAAAASSSSAVACRVANRFSAFATAAPSSAFSLDALRASDEVLAAICGHLAAAARRAALHAAAAPEVTGSSLYLPSPRESDPTAPHLDSTSTSTSAFAAGTGGEDFATSSSPALSPSFLTLLQAAGWTHGVLGCNYKLTPMEVLLLPPGTSSWFYCNLHLATGGEDFATSSTPALSPSFLLVLQAAGWARGVLGSNSWMDSYLASSVSPAISVASNAPSGLLLLHGPTWTRQVRPPTQVCSPPLYISAGPSMRRSFSVSSSPPKGPHPPSPSLRDVRFLVALMDGMVLSPEDFMYLRQVLDKKCTQDNASARLDRLERKVDLILKNVDAGNQLILRTLLQKVEWGSIKIFGRTIDVTKIAEFLRTVIVFITTGGL